MNGDQREQIRKRRPRAEIEQLVAEFVNGGMKRSEFCRSCGLALSTLDRHLKKQGEKRRSGLEQISNPTLLIIHRTFTNTDSKIALLGATKSVHYCSVGNPSVP
jgi:hypothetical protein